MGAVADGLKWCELDARQYLEDNPNVENGDGVALLNDRTGSGRHAFGEGTGSAWGTADPLFAHNACAGKPGIFFDGAGMAFRSAVNGSTSEFFLSNQRTWFPAAFGSMFAVVMAVRVPAGATTRHIISMIRDGSAGGDVWDTTFFANASIAHAFPLPVSSGRIFGMGPFENQVVGAHPPDAPYDSEYGFALITYVSPGAESWDVFEPGFAQRAHWRINGVPVDRFGTLSDSQNLFSTAKLAMSFGGMGAEHACSDFEGYLLNMTVLRDYKSDRHKAIGVIEVASNPPTSNAGQTVVINDGANPAITYEFGVGVDTSVKKWVAPGATFNTAAAALLAKINVVNGLGESTIIALPHTTVHPTTPGLELRKVLLQNTVAGKKGHQGLIFSGGWWHADRSWGITAKRVLDCPEYPDVAYVAGATPTEVEEMEGRVAWRFGSSHKLPDSSSSFPHPYHLDNGPPVGSTTVDEFKLVHTGAILTKYSASGELKWILTDNEKNPLTGGTEVGGFGYGLALASDGSIFTVGPHVGADTVSARRIIDFGDTFSLDSDDAAWAYSFDDGATPGPVNVQEQQYQYPRLGVDKFDNLYIPRDTLKSTDATSTTDEDCLVVLKFAGTAGAGQVETRFALPTTADHAPQRGRAVVIDLADNSPDYRNDSITRAENVYLLTENQGGRRANGALVFNAVGALGDNWTVNDGINPAVTFELVNNPGGVVTIPGASPVFAIGAGATAQTTALAAQVSMQLAYQGPSPTPIVIAPTHVFPSNLVRLLHDRGGVAYNLAITSSFATAADVTITGMVNGSNEGEAETVHKIRLVAGVGSSIPQRERYLLAMNEGQIRVFDRTGENLVPSSVGCYATTARFLSTATLFGEMFIFDGTSRGGKVWKAPTPSLPYGEVVDLVATGAGAVPARANLATAWAGRLVIARGHAYWMSGRGDPYDWDLFPDEPTGDSAIFGDDVEITGPAPDLIVGLRALSDDVLVVKGDTSIHLIRGNPRLGGQMHLVQSGEGGVYGEADAIDPEGIFYYMGSKGGVWAILPGYASPKRITRDRIERQLQDIDHAKYRVEMTWDYKNEGLMIGLVPWVEGLFDEDVTGWFWDKKNDGWWPVNYTDRLKQPTAYFEHEGDDPADRAVLLGGADGYMGFVDRVATNDRGTAVASKVLIGPIVNPDAQNEVEIDSLIVVLGAGQQAIKYRLLAGNDAESLDKADVLAEDEFIAGRNEVHSCRGVGAALWLELFNNAVNERWAIESITANLHQGGPVRSYQ